MRDYFEAVLRTLVPVTTRVDRAPRRGRVRGRRSTFLPLPPEAAARPR